MSNAPPSGRTRYFHTNTITPPATIPDIAPASVLLFQNNAQSITAPKAAPNPAHANDTIPNTLEFGFLAINTATTAIATIVSLAVKRLFFSSISTWKKS